MNKTIKQYSSKNKFINAFVIFGIAYFLASSLSSVWGDWEKEILLEQAQNSQAKDYFIYYDLFFEKWGWHITEYSWYEPIVYFSDRAIFKDIDSMNFSEDIYSDKNGDGIYNNGKIILPPDLNNPKELHKQKTFKWTLPITCHELWKWNYKVEHTIWINLIDWITKKQTLYTYFSCNTEDTK